MDPNIDFVPVSALLEAASNELEVGQLLQTSVFSLFEAMSSLEIGNPKMDAGARPKGDTTPLEQRAMQLDLTPQQLLGVMDHVMCLEATWHNGGALARTVYSSIFMMQPNRTAAQAVLSAYCRAVEALCAEVNQLIMIGCVCEEEDFNAHIAGLPLEHTTTAAGAAASGAAAAPGSSSSSISTGSSSSNSEKLLASISHAIDSQDLSLKQRQAGSSDHVAGAAAAIVSRLHFRKLILQGLIKLKKRTKQDLDQAAKLFLKAQGELASIRSSLGLGVDQGLGWDENLNSHLVPAVPPRAVKVYSGEGAVDYFDSLLTQLIRVCNVTHVNSYHTLKDFLLSFAAQGCCPVARSALHIQVAYNAWVPLITSPHQAPAAAAAAGGSSGDAAATTTTSSSSSSTYDEKHHQHHIPPPTHHNVGASSSSSSQPEQQPVVANGTAVAAAAAAAAAAVSLPVWTLSPRMLRAALQLSLEEDLGPDGELFLEQAVIATGNVVQALLMNRSRCRRRLRRALEDWANLYQHGLNADTSPQFDAYMAVRRWAWHNEHPNDPAGPLATWVEAETCCVMVHHLLMGFELQLYEPADYGMVYWYIDVLCRVWQQRSKQLSEQRPAFIEAPAAGSSSSRAAAAAGNGHAGPRLPSKASSSSKSSSKSKSSSGSGGGSGGTSSDKAATAADKSPSTGYVLSTNIMLEVWKQIAMGMLRAMMSLQLLGMYKPPELPFNSEAQRFDQRFASFHLLQRPDPLSYDQFCRSTSTEGVSTEKLLALAYDSFRKAQQAASVLKTQAAAWGTTKQQLADLAPLERVAATNAVAVSLLSRAAASSSKTGSSNDAAAAQQSPQFKPFFEFGHSKWFPTLTLKSASAAGK